MSPETTSPTPETTGHRPQIQAINRAIRAEDDRLRAAHPWLAHQDMLGAVCFFGSLIAMAAIAACYTRGTLGTWITIVLMAMPLSIMHELEHDLIHGLYFRRAAWVQNSLFLIIWLCKLSMNPWVRRTLHLRHHRRSGQVDDVEERLIGLGVPFGWRRIALMLPVGSLLLAPSIHHDIRKERRKEGAPREPGGQSMPPVTLIALDTFLILVVPAWAIYGALNASAWATAVLVCLVAPNVLRHFCAAVVSSYSHYYGDIAPNDVFLQNQVLSHWSLFPLQLFCFNFGCTHIIHHYVVDQPFYLRQMVASRAIDEMRRAGVRVNDARIVLRANRWATRPSWARTRA